MGSTVTYQDSFNSAGLESDLEEFGYTVTIVGDPSYSPQPADQPSQRDYLNVADNGSLDIFKDNSYPNFTSFSPTFSSENSMLEALNSLRLNTQDLPSFNSTRVDQYDEQDLLQPPTSPYYLPSPSTSYDGSGPSSAPLRQYTPSPYMVFSGVEVAGSGHAGRGRSRSLSSVSTSPYHSAWRGRSPGASSFTHPIGRGSDRNRESSVVSDNSSLEHINPLFLSSHVHGTAPSLCESSPTLYPGSLNGSVSSLAPSDSGREDEQANKYRANVATQRIQAASAKRRKKDPRFFCSEPGCNQGFTAKHNLINHENSHRGVRRFKCIRCNDTFVTRSVMDRHAKRCSANKARKTKA